MRLRKLWAAAFLMMTALLVEPAQALESTQFMVDPYLGYGFLGNMDQNGTDLGTSSGLGFGSRVGIEAISLLFGGLDVSYFPSLSVSGTDASVIGSGSGNVRVGVVAGVNVPIFPIRAWLGYNFVDFLWKSNDNGSTNSLSGHSFKIGAGVKIIPLVSLNMEYFFTGYGSAIVGGRSAAGLEPSGKFLFFSASVPLSL